MLNVNAIRHCTTRGILEEMVIVSDQIWSRLTFSAKEHHMISDYKVCFFNCYMSVLITKTDQFESNSTIFFTKMILNLLKNLENLLKVLNLVEETHYFQKIPKIF